LDAATKPSRRLDGSAPEPLASAFTSLNWTLFFDGSSH
jgi:ribonuclease HI